MCLDGLSEENMRCLDTKNSENDDCGQDECITKPWRTQGGCLVGAQLELEHARNPCLHFHIKRRERDAKITDLGLRFPKIEIYKLVLCFPPHFKHRLSMRKMIQNVGFLHFTFSHVSTFSIFPNHFELDMIWVLAHGMLPHCQQNLNIHHVHHEVYEVWREGCRGGGA